MPGLGASSKIFEFIKLDKKFKLIKLDWISPFENESLSSYAKRMTRKIKHENPYILGVSFGGILVQEMSVFYKFSKVIIVSSIKSKFELPISMVLVRKTNANIFFPSKWINNIENLVLFVFGDFVKKKVMHYKRYLSVRDPQYLKWAVKQQINWKRTSIISNLVHIHGDKDNVFPTRYIKNAIIVKDGTHAMILIKSDWFNKNLPLLLK